MLVADDSDDLRDDMRVPLEEAGYTVFAARNGLEASEIVRDSRRAVNRLILDILLPGMNGMELAQQVTTLNSKVKILFASYDCGPQPGEGTEHFRRMPC